MPDLRAVPGDPTSPATGAIRGMINMMQSLRKDVRADYVACVFDAKGPTFRDDWYPQYKANRAPMPDDLRAQIPPIHEVVRLLGWTVLDVPGVEADDVIGTLAVVAARQGIEVIVSSGDKDLSQLVNEHITIIDTMNGKRRDLAGVAAEFGVPARPDGGLPDAGGRCGRQRARRREGRPQDRGQVAAGIWFAGRAGERSPARSRAWPARTCARPWTGCPGPTPADHQDRLRSGWLCGWPACAGCADHRRHGRRKP
jgi:hypothetical protein